MMGAMMTNYLSIWAEAVQAYESLANVVKTADEAIRQSLDLARAGREVGSGKQRTKAAVGDSRV
jgi:hypothetical protein